MREMGENIQQMVTAFLCRRLSASAVPFESPWCLAPVGGRPSTLVHDYLVAICPLSSRLVA